MANAGASMLQGFLVSSSASRSAIAVATGRKTQVYSLLLPGPSPLCSCQCCGRDCRLR